MDSSDDLLQHFASRRTRVGVMESVSGKADALHVASSLVDTNPDMHFEILDQKALQGCLNECLEAHLLQAAPHLAATYTPGPAPLQGSLAVAQGCALDLQHLPDRLFAMEVAGLYAGVEATARALAVTDGQTDVVVYEISLMGVSGVAKQYGQDSCQAVAAAAATAHIMKWTASTLDQAYGGDVVYVVNLIAGDAAVHAAPVTGLMALKEGARRSLLANTTLTPDQVAQKFSTRAAAFGSFVIILYFSLAALYCMCNMPFKQDTLLYTRAKVD